MPSRTKTIVNAFPERRPDRNVLQTEGVRGSDQSDTRDFDVLAEGERQKVDFEAEFRQRLCFRSHPDR